MNRCMCGVIFALIGSGLSFGRSGPLMTAAAPACFVSASAGLRFTDPAAQQQTTPPDQQAVKPAVVIVQLSKSLDSRKLTAGNSIEAKVTADLRWNGTVIPRGSKVIGHITEASSRAKGDPASALGMVFDRIALKDGTELPLKANIQAVGPQPGFGLGDAEPQYPHPMAAPGGPGSVGGPPSPIGVGAPQTTFPPNPSAGAQPTSTQGNRQDSGGITAGSTGVVGLPDLQLQGDSILASGGKEVKLAAGSQLLLRLQSQ
jgi:hypothetical protein